MLRVRRCDGVIDTQQVLVNPHQHVSRAKGIRVAEWLVEHKVDEVRLREAPKHEGPGYVFGDAGLAVVPTDADHLASLVDEIAVR
jgi:predicted Fe-Mo cluster-binding NifX family protein